MKATLGFLAVAFLLANSAFAADKEVTTAVSWLLASADIETRIKGAEKLKSLGDRATEAIPALEKASTKDKSPLVRLKACEALIELNAPIKALPSLKSLVTTKTAALKQTREKAETSLMKAIDLIGAAPSRDTIDLLLPYTEIGSDSVRVSAENAVAKSCGKLDNEKDRDFIPALIKLRDGTTNKVIIASAVETLKRMGVTREYESWLAQRKMFVHVDGKFYPTKITRAIPLLEEYVPKVGELIQVGECTIDKVRAGNDMIIRLNSSQTRLVDVATKGLIDGQKWRGPSDQGIEIAIIGTCDVLLVGGGSKKVLLAVTKQRLDAGLTFEHFKTMLKENAQKDAIK